MDRDAVARVQQETIRIGWRLHRVAAETDRSAAPGQRRFDNDGYAISRSCAHTHVLGIEDRAGLVAMDRRVASGLRAASCSVVTTTGRA